VGTAACDRETGRQLPRLASGSRDREAERQRSREAERQRDRETERQRGRERGQDTSMSVRSAREPRHFGPHEAHVELEAHTPMGGSSRLRALQSALGSATTSRWSAHACGSSPSSSPSSSSSSSGASTGDGSIVALAPPVDGDPAQTAAIVKAFKRDGAVIVKGVFSAAECAALRQRIDRLFDAQAALAAPAEQNGDSAASAEVARSPVGAYVVQKCYLVDRALARLFAHPVIYELMESIFGSDFQQCGNNSLRTTEGAHRAEQWHVDPPVWFPLPPGMDRHDPRIEMPVFWLTVQLAFTDIGPDDGPTEYVLGSHYSGREPPIEEPPVAAGARITRRTVRSYT
jgi:hypothetical protein